MATECSSLYPHFIAVQLSWGVDLIPVRRTLWPRLIGGRGRFFVHELGEMTSWLLLMLMLSSFGMFPLPLTVIHNRL